MSSSEIDVCSAGIHGRVPSAPCTQVFAFRQHALKRVWDGLCMGPRLPRIAHVRCATGEPWRRNKHLVTFLWKTRFSFLSLQPSACIRGGSASCTLGGPGAGGWKPGWRLWSAWPPPSLQRGLCCPHHGKAAGSPLLGAGWAQGAEAEDQESLGCILGGMPGTADGDGK